MKTLFEFVAKVFLGVTIVIMLLILYRVWEFATQ